jgi:hypothetical protein
MQVFVPGAALLRNSFDGLLDRLVPVSEGIRGLGRDGWRVDIFCGLHPKYGNEGFVLDHTLIHDLDTIGFDIFSSWYRDDDEDHGDVAKDRPRDVD